jgi:hypothetical protein
MSEMSERDFNDAYDDLMGFRRLPKGGSLRSRCSLCDAPSVTHQKGYQRCEVCWELDEDQIEHSLPGDTR